MAEDLQAQLDGLREQIEAELEGKAPGQSAGSWWTDNGAAASLRPGEPPQLVRILRGHFGKVYSIHWAGDSRRLVSASQDGKLIVWNATTTNKVQAIPLRSTWVMSCAFEQAENKLVACGGLDNTCSVYQLSSEGGLSVTKAHRELSGHDGYLSCCRFNGPNQLISSSGDGSCIQWDVETGSEIEQYWHHQGDVMSVSISPKQPHVFASGSTDATVRIVDMRSNRCTMTFWGHESDVNSVSFFPDGMAVGSGSDDATCKLFDVRSCRELGSYGTDSIVCGVPSVDFSRSGRILFAGYDDLSCCGWDVTGKEPRPIQIRCHENRVSSLHVNPSGDALCTGSWDALLRVLA